MPLPPGLAVNPLTGVISGTPTEAGTFSFTLRVRDAQGSQRDIPQAITVSPYTAPSLSGTMLAYATNGVPYSSGFTGAGTGLVWSVSSGVLPTGLTINASTGVVSGTPNDVSYTTRNLTITATDVVGALANRAHTLSYAAPLSLGGDFDSGIIGTAYSASLARAGGHSPFTYTISSGALPAGLSLSPTTGVVSGTPTTAATTAVTIRVQDAAGNEATRARSITINTAYVGMTLGGSTTQGFTFESLSSFSTAAISATVTGGSTPKTYSWARISGSSSINASAPTALLTGFFGDIAPGGNASAVFRLTVNDSVTTATRDFTVTVTNLYVSVGLSASLPLSTQTVAYSTALSPTGGKAPFMFTVVSGTLPTGISLNASTGVISGTPSDASGTDRAMTFRVVDVLGGQADASATLVYRTYPTLSYAFSRAMRTRAYSAAATQAGGHGGGSYTIVSGSLPTGISLNGSTGAVSGTPSSTSYSTYAVTIRYTDSAGNAVSAAGSIIYADNLTVTGTVTGSGVAGTAYSSAALSSAGGHGGNVWSIASGSLPPGLSISALTGAVTGTPSLAGGYSFVARVTDVGGFTADSASQSITIGAAVSAAVNSATATGSVSIPFLSPPTTTVTTSPNTVVTASGGTPGYTYSWARIGGNSSITATAPSSATTAFTSASVIRNDIFSASFRCTVTDSSFATATVDVSVSLTYIGGAE